MKITRLVGKFLAEHPEAGEALMHHADAIQSVVAIWVVHNQAITEFLKKNQEEIKEALKKEPVNLELN